jgi:hypothetical protein
VLLHVGVVELATHQAFDGEDGVDRVGGRLALGDLPDEALASTGEADDRRSGASTVTVGDDLDVGFAVGVRALHHCDARVGGAEIDSDHFRHALYRGLPSQGFPSPVRPLRRWS